MGMAQSLGARAVMNEQIPQNLSMPGAKIELSLGRLDQLFNSFDPSPFYERGLDEDAEDYIVGSAEEMPGQQPSRLVIDVPTDQFPKSGVADLAEAIHNHFSCRENQKRRELRLLFRDGRIALVIGIGFLLCCSLFRELAHALGNDAVWQMLDQGMIIIGWVAMWRPMEIFLYEWVPIRRRCRVLAALSKIPVMVQQK